MKRALSIFILLLGLVPSLVWGTITTTVKTTLNVSRHVPIIAAADIDVRAIGTATGAGIAYSFEGWVE
jgi:ABC-type phosphate/phosphonate transport system permease subunit